MKTIVSIIIAGLLAGCCCEDNALLRWEVAKAKREQAASEKEARIAKDELTKVRNQCRDDLAALRGELEQLHVIIGNVREAVEDNPK